MGMKSTQSSSSLPDGRRRAILALLCAPLVLVPFELRAETLADALMQAYRANPQLNSGRASLRAEDENVPRALSQFRPRANADAFLGYERRRSVQTSYEIDNGDFLEPKIVDSIMNTRGAPRSAILSVEQPLFDGFKTLNAARAAETNVFAGRERLKLLEQRVLFSAVTAYMNVLRDSAAVKLQQSNVAVLAEQLRQVKERYAAGQLTLTDISQAESRLAGGRAQLAAARGALEASLGAYRQVMGCEPRKLSPANPVDRLLPRTRAEAEAIAQREHPLVLAALHDADAADLDIKTIESEYLPSLSMTGDIYTQSDVSGGRTRAVGARVLGKLSVPIYSGGETSARVRQAKELAGQKRFDSDVARAELLALLRTNWGSLQAAKTQVSAAQAQIAAAERALAGVREEAKAGQRTTIEILNAQQELLNARIGLIAAQRDRVVASYAALAALGRLSARDLALDVDHYDPALHFEQVKDSWGSPGGQ